MSELQLQVILDKNLASEVEGVVAFGDFKPKNDDSVTAIYTVDEAHLFYRDLILGRPMPFILVARSLETMGVLVSVALFLCRDLAINPGVPGLFSAVNLMDAYGTAGLAHVDRDLAKFLKFIRTFLAHANGKNQEALGSVVNFLRDYLMEGCFPALPPDPDPPRIVDRGTDGFVFAVQEDTDLLGGWEEMYRQGFLRGFILRQESRDRWHVLAARKSPYLSFDLKKAAGLLNEMEMALGEPPEWITDGLWLRGPERGTLILPTVLLSVFVRI